MTRTRGGLAGRGVLYSLARVRLAGGDTAAARALLGRARELAPEDTTITAAQAALGGR